MAHFGGLFDKGNDSWDLWEHTCLIVGRRNSRVWSVVMWCVTCVVCVRDAKRSRVYIQNVFVCCVPSKRTCLM